MKNTGLYICKEVTKTPALKESDHDYYGSQGAVSRATRERNVLSINGRKVASAKLSSKHAGLYTLGNRLMLDGHVVAKTSSPCGIVGRKGLSLAGGIALNPNAIADNGHGDACINITLEDYNQLRAGSTLEGYKSYDPLAVYNIVDDIHTAEIVHYANTEGKEDLLYNNIVGLAEDNVETDATFLDMDAPHLSVYEPSQRIVPGGMLSLDYMVDTRRMAALRGYVEGGEAKIGFGDTFTVIIRDSHDVVLYKKTTYAGLFHIEIGPFDSEGEEWISVQCIDNHGRGSAVYHAEFLVKEAEDMSKLYDMTEADLATYRITPARRVGDRYLDFRLDTGYIDSNIVAYRNKIGITKLMRDKASAGYSGVRLYNPYLETEGTDMVYYIDYHENIAEKLNPTNVNLDCDVDLGNQTFWLFKIETVNGERSYSTEQIVQGGSVQVGAKSYMVDSEALEWVMGDGAHLYRDGDDKIKVCWQGYELDSKKEVTYQGIGEYLRTYNLDHWLLKDNQWKSLADGVYYAVRSTIPYDTGLRGGDNIVFPDNFTLDMNDVVLRGSYSENLRVNAKILELCGNHNTHVVNGHVEGLYGRYNFRRAFFQQSIKYEGVPAESVSNVGMLHSRYCSFENVESAYSLGYEGSVDMFHGTTDILLDYSKFLIEFTDGFIDNTGAERTAAPIAALSSDSSDRKRANSTDETPDGTDSISLVHTVEFTSPKAVYDRVHIRPSFYSMGVGKQHELFVSFYHHDGTFCKTVKTHLYWAVMVPTEILSRCASEGQKNYKIKLTMYGVTKPGDTGRVVPMTTMYGGTEKPKALERLLIGACTKGYGANNSYKDCYWHDTRTCALNGVSGKNTVYDGCVWERIACEPPSNNGPDMAIASGVWHLTHTMAHMEEGGPWRDTVTIKNCRGDRGLYRMVPTRGGYAGQELVFHTPGQFNLHYVRNLKFVGNEGFLLLESGVESAIITGNKLASYSADRKYVYERPCIYFRHNVIRCDLRVKYTNNSNSHTQTTKYVGTFRDNRCDDPVDTVFALNDVVAAINKSSDYTPTRFNFITRDTKIEGLGIDTD